MGLINDMVWLRYSVFISNEYRGKGEEIDYSIPFSMEVIAFKKRAKIENEVVLALPEDTIYLADIILDTQSLARKDRPHGRNLRVPINEGRSRGINDIFDFGRREKITESGYARL